MPESQISTPRLDGSPGRSGGRRCLRVALALLCAGAALLLATRAEAVQYRVRSVSIGRATQHFRVDRSVVAPRILTQGISLWGYDLLDDQSGSLNLHLSMRYTSDFSLLKNERQNPYFDRSWNALSLDLAYLDWRPYRALRLRLGRQWSQGALGARDFDGLRVQLSPGVGPSTRAHLEAFGGRDVESAYAWFAPAQFDVMGLPIEDSPYFEGADSLHWIAGVGAGLRWGRVASVEMSWRRRWTTGVNSELLSAAHQPSTVVGSERFGMATSASVHPRLVTSAWGSFHTLLNRVDHAGLQLAWQIPAVESTLSAGVEHRLPWFDSQSIFNLFGARPYQASFASYQHHVAAIRTDFQVRGWGRYYPGSDDVTPYSGVHYSPHETRERALGASVGHLSRVRIWDRAVRWNTQVSWQASLDRKSDQWMTQLHLRLPIFGEDLFLSGRGLFLAAVRDTPHAPLGRPEPGGFVSPERDALGFATTGVLGLELPISDYGTFSASAVTTAGSFYPTNTSLYASFRLEHWP